MKDIEAYSTTTGKTYPNWDALVEAESNGYLLIALITGARNNQTWPWVEGPFPSKEEAEKARRRLRRKWKREQSQPFSMWSGQTYKFFVRPAWKADR